MRQVVLDTETTGMNRSGGPPHRGHRVIEIGAVEIVDRCITRRNFHAYLRPDRLVDPDAFGVHGIGDSFLADKPSFADLADTFIEFVRGSALVIHNAPFDVGFINQELEMAGCCISKVESCCQIIDSLQLARKNFPGKRNSLDALCDRYLIPRKDRKLHSALLDAEILSRVFLLMTGGQIKMPLAPPSRSVVGERERRQDGVNASGHLKIIRASDDELAGHERQLDLVEDRGGCCLWRSRICRDGEDGSR